MERALIRDYNRRVLVFFALAIVAVMIIPGYGTATLSEDIQVHDIDPVDSYSQNVTSREKAQFVFVVRYTALSGNTTILLSNSSSDHRWIVETTDDMFILEPNSSEVVRVTIWPEAYKQGYDCEITFRILAVRDSESYEVIRVYTVTVPEGEKEASDGGEEDEGIEILGYHIDLPDSIDNKIGRFSTMVFFWFLMTVIVLLLLDPIIKSLTKKTKTELDDLILNVVRKPLFLIIILYGLVESLKTVEPSDEIIDILSRVYGLVFFTIVFYTGYKIFTVGLTYMDKLAENTTLGHKVHHSLVPALTKVGSIIFFFIGLNVILGYFGMDLALLLGGMTLMGLVIAFAAQDTLSNFFGGMFLILEPEFKEEDTIVLQGTTYTVKNIGMRTTQLYDISNHALVIIPNNILANEKIVDLTEPDRRIKMNIEIGVAYGTDIDLVEDTLLSIAKAHPEIITESDSPPFVRFMAFGGSSLDFKLFFWVRDLIDRFRVRHEVMKRVYKKFDELSINIPFPQRVVHLMEGESETVINEDYEGTKVDELALHAEVPGIIEKPEYPLDREMKLENGRENESNKERGNIPDQDIYRLEDDGDGGGGDGGGDE